MSGRWKSRHWQRGDKSSSPHPRPPSDIFGDDNIGRNDFRTGGGRNGTSPIPGRRRPAHEEEEVLDAGGGREKGGPGGAYHPSTAAGALPSQPPVRPPEAPLRWQRAQPLTSTPPTSSSTNKCPVGANPGAGYGGIDGGGSGSNNGGDGEVVSADADLSRASFSPAPRNVWGRPPPPPVAGADAGTAVGNDRSARSSSESLAKTATVKRPSPPSTTSSFWKIAEAPPHVGKSLLLRDGFPTAKEASSVGGALPETEEGRRFPAEVSTATAQRDAKIAGSTTSGPKKRGGRTWGGPDPIVQPPIPSIDKGGVAKDYPSLRDVAKSTTAVTTTTVKGRNGPPPSSSSSSRTVLPSATSWGKSSVPAAAKQTAEGGALRAALAKKAADKQPKADEFPSLSTGLSAPRHQRHLQRDTTPQPRARPAAHPSKKQPTKTKGGGGGANLASFLVNAPKLTVAKAESKSQQRLSGQPAKILQKKKLQASAAANAPAEVASSSYKAVRLATGKDVKRSATASSASTVKAVAPSLVGAASGKKRNVGSAVGSSALSFGVRVARDDPHHRLGATVAACHPNIQGNGASVLVGAGRGGISGGMLSFPVAKKGRQRLGPRKKKLTTLKKRVLLERLRVWREQNGVADGREAEKIKKAKSEDTSAVALVDSTTIASQGGMSVRIVTPGEGHRDVGISSIYAPQTTATVHIDNFVRPDEDNLADEDEYDEIVSNLIALAVTVGKVRSVFVPRPAADDSTEERTSNDVQMHRLEAESVGRSFVRFAFARDARAAIEVLNGTVVGGQRIRVSLLSEKGLNDDVGGDPGGAAYAPSEEEDRQWRLSVMTRARDEEKSSSGPRDESPVDSLGTESNDHCDLFQSTAAARTIIFRGILCDDDYEDEDALLESIEDIKDLSRQYGEVVEARATIDGPAKGNVSVVYEALSSAATAALKLNGLVVGGMVVQVSLEINPSQSDQLRIKPAEVVLNNVLNESDLGDEDCLEESICDISSIARQFGLIGAVRAETSGEPKVRVEYLDGYEVARTAAHKFDGMVIGGLIVSAHVASKPGGSPTGNDSMEKSSSSNSNTHKKVEDEPPSPMFSGDKVIPESFAACMRVPKVPNAGIPRPYASKINDESATPLLIEMLGELMRLQVRSKDDKNARARRRLVMGLREVARGIRAHKIKMVAMANNLDEYGAIDSKLQEILDLAEAEDLPVLFELNKRKLGRALGKSIKVSVVGIQNADGAHEQFKKLKKVASVPCRSGNTLK